MLQKAVQTGVQWYQAIDQEESEDQDYDIFSSMRSEEQTMKAQLGFKTSDTFLQYNITEGSDVHFTVKRYDKVSEYC
jgi:hypothetical protein